MFKKLIVLFFSLNLFSQAVPTVDRCHAEEECITFSEEEIKAGIVSCKSNEETIQAFEHCLEDTFLGLDKKDPKANKAFQKYLDESFGGRLRD